MSKNLTFFRLSRFDISHDFKSGLIHKDQIDCLVSAFGK